MTFVLAGVAAGLIMSTVFVGIAPIMLVVLAKDPPSFLRSILDRAPPIFITMNLAVLAYPTWTLFGAVVGLVYRAVDSDGATGGLGSPNLGFTVGLLAVSILAAIPLALLMRRVALGFVALALAFAGSYGWLLPILSTAR